MLNHLAGDGKSLSYFIETFMRAMAGMEIQYVGMKSLEVEDLPKKSRLPIFTENT